jgi:hypothetical protein
LSVFFFVAIGPTARVSAQEIDLSVTNTSAVESDPTSSGAVFDQGNRLSAAFRWDASEGLRVRSSGYAAVATDFRDSTELHGDLRTLALVGEYPVRSAKGANGRGAGESRADDREDTADGDASPGAGRSFARSPVLRFTLGRQHLSEFSGFIMNTHVDGVSVSYTTPLIDVGLAGGYTGLQLRNANAVVASPEEASDADNPFAPSRALARVSIAFPEIASRQSVLLSGIGTLDLPELASADGAPFDETYHSMHLGAGVTGPISRRLFYTLFGYYYRPWYVRAVGDLDSGNGTAAGGSLRYYREELAYSNFQLRGAFATGDSQRSNRTGFEGQDSAHFVPVTDPSLNNLVDVALTNLWLAEASYSFRPFAPDYPANTGFQVEARLQALGRPVRGVGSVTGLAASTPAGYLATATNAEIRYRPTSDLTLRVTGSVLWPTNVAVEGGLVSDARSRLRAGMEARLAF